MDRIIEKKPAAVPRWAIFTGLGLLALILAWQVLSHTGSSRLSIDASRITTSVVRRSDFLEYYPFDGTVQPAKSVYLDVDQGGRVDVIYAEGGQHVNKGDLILKFSNATLQRTAIDTETNLLYNLDIQRNSKFNRADNTRLLREQLLDLEHQILDAQNKLHRYDELIKAGNEVISAEQFETQSNEVRYLIDHRELLQERIREEDQLAKEEVTQAQKSIDRLNESLQLLAQIVKSLEVRAPISGYLSTIDAEVGQNINPGQRIGQIDLLDKFKVSTKIDQFYIAKVAIGTPGHVNLDGRVWDVKVTKIYPEVKDSAFTADVVFTGDVPESLKRGQTLTVELSFGEPTRALTVAKGGFFQQTSGRWVYVLSKDGRSARRTEVRLGRQNPREVEVLEGLNEGDRIITSSYDSFNSVDELRFNAAISGKGTT